MVGDRVRICRWYRTGLFPASVSALMALSRALPRICPSPVLTADVREAVDFPGVSGYHFAPESRCTAILERIFQLKSAKSSPFDRNRQISHSYACPVKRRRATLRSDPSRDNRMRLRRIFRPGEATIGFPASYHWNILSCLPCLKKPRGFGGRAP